MKKGIGTLPVIIFILLFAWWFNRYPAYSNKYTANIVITHKGVTIHSFDSVQAGLFKFYLKKNPREIVVRYKGKKYELFESDDKHFAVQVDYLDPKYADDVFK